MTEAVPCLLRIGDNVKKYRLFKLERDQVTIGRSGDVTYAILSNMISRCHAVIDRKEDGSWDITDKKSLNGIYVNGRQLTPFKPYTMQEGDMVQFGVPTAPDTPAEFVYKFYSSLKVRIEKKNSSKRLKTDYSLEKDTLSQSASETLESDSEREMKRKIPGEKQKDGVPDSSPNKALHQQIEKSQKEQAQREAEYQARLAQMEQLLKEKEEKQREVQHELEKEREEKENQAKEVEELRLKEQAILQEMHDKQEELEKEKESLKQKMQEELEESLKAREQALKDQLTAQREALMNEKKQVEDNLQQEMEKALEEKNKELEEQLMEQKQKLEKVIEKKQLEQKMLESQLCETKEESATAKLQALQAREDVLSNFADLMEMELQCAICNELFIKATSLNCSHVFCKLCINQWMKVKKECPNCRSPITSQMQALALDSYIDRMVEQLNEDLKQRRKEVLDSRKVEQEKFDGPAVVRAGPSTAASASRGAVSNRGGARGRGRGGGPPRGGASTISNVSVVSSTNNSSHSSIISTRAASRRGARGGASSAASSSSSAAAAAGASHSRPAVSSSLRPTVSATGTASIIPAPAIGASASIAASVSITPLAPSTTSTTTAAGAVVVAAAAASTHGPVIDLTEVPAAIVTVPSGTGVIDLSSDRENNGEEEEENEEEEEEEEEEENSNDSIYRYRYRRRYYDTEDEEEEERDSDDVEGDEDAYYGGYGRCYKCGMRGHWANGCPN